MEISGDIIISILTLTVLEIVLGIDNIIFISIVAAKLPKEQQKLGRQIGLVVALVARIILLSTISWIIGLKQPVFSIGQFQPTGRDLILFSGGVFLVYKTVVEIIEKLQGHHVSETEKTEGNQAAKFGYIIFQIVLVDIVFSFDSILTAVGLASELWVMITAVVLSMGIMLVFAGPVSDFVNKYPTIKMLALSFLVLIGVLLILESFHEHIEKGYLYFAMAFACGVELLNMRMRRAIEAAERED